MMPDPSVTSKAQPNYVLLDGNSGSVFCVLDILENFEDSYKFDKGWSLTGEWPRNAAFRMEPSAPKQIRLSDYLCNHDSIIVASKRLQEFFLAEKVPNIELLPVTIYDHKKRVASRDYAIIHLVTVQNCIDTAASEVKWNNIHPDKIMFMKRLVIDESKIDPSAVVFRAMRLSTQIFVKREFSAKMASTGFTGFRFWELSDYRG